MVLIDLSLRSIIGATGGFDNGRLWSLCEMEMETRGEDTLLSPAILFFKGQVSLGDNYRIDGESEMALRKEDC